MIRKAILLAASFAVLLGGFWIYQSLSGAAWTTTSREPLGSQEDLLGPDQNAAKGPEVRIRGEDGRLEAVYSASKVRKETNGSFTLTRPRFEVHLSNGQVVYVRAQEASVIGEEVSNGVEPHSGSMRGQVQVDIDRNPRSMPPSQRPDELIRIRLDDIRFDKQLLTLRSQGRVVVWSREADIVGQGFFMSWNEEPRELRKLRIDRGEYMAVKDLKDELDMVFLPGGQGRSAEPETPEAPASPGPGGDLRQSDARQEATPDPTRPPAAATRPARNMFQATLHENVQVFSGERSMRGADLLTLLFQWEGEFEDPMQSGDADGVDPGQTASAQPDAGEDSDAGPEAPSTQTRSPSRSPNEALMIYWTGVLELAPTGHAARPDSKHYRIEAAGEDIALSDGQTRAHCQNLIFRNPERVGKLSMVSDAPVRLMLEDGQRAEVPEISFDLLRREAFFVGQGRMLSPAGQGRQLVSAPMASNRPPAVGADGSELKDEIRWSKSVEIRFRQRQTGSSRDQAQMLDSAVFKGDVELYTAGGDYLLCDEQLLIDMASGQGGRAYPRSVRAEGNAWASWEQSALEASWIRISFTQQRAEGEGQGQWEIQPSRLEAGENVYVASLIDGEDLFEAYCQQLDSDLLIRSATLTGEPARTRSGGDSLDAREIFVQRKVAGDTGREGMDLYAAGEVKLAFTTDRDLNGNRLDKPRPMVINSNSLEFLSLFDTAKFKGDVELVSTSQTQTPDDPQTIQTDTLGARELRLLFVPAAPGAPASEAQESPTEAGMEAEVAEEASSTGSRSLALDMGSYSGRKISTMIAGPEVEVVSRQADSDDRTLVKMTLQGNELTYDTMIRQIVMAGRGKLLVEDYRPSRLPKADKTPGEDVTLAGEVVAPSQTAFAWRESMTLKQDKREVLLEGEVRMAHVNGNQVVYADRLEAPEWGKLESGKRLDLRRADVLIARFSDSDPASQDQEQPVESPENQPEEKLDPNLGRLESLTARGNVLLEDETVSIAAESLTYVRPLKLVTILGHLPGRPAKPAQLTQTLPQSRRQRIFQGRRILWYLQNDHVQVEDARAGAGR